ncbi:MAG: hypothetical protein VX777_09280 [Chlamydiota bacterium]|nr:hypothetical protein [Chlamydiota bacterium]
MLVERELQKIFQELMANDSVQIFLDGYDVSVQVFDDSSKLAITTPVYFGGNYIPKSVRAGIKKSPPFDRSQTIKTTLNINEETYRIFLNYLGSTETFNNNKFSQLLDDFCHLAEEWRIYLDEQDKNDRVYVNAI